VSKSIKKNGSWKDLSQQFNKSAAKKSKAAVSSSRPLSKGQIHKLRLEMSQTRNTLEYSPRGSQRRAYNAAKNNRICREIKMVEAGLQKRKGINREFNQSSARSPSLSKNFNKSSGMSR
jgi:hypothetical protein